MIEFDLALGLTVAASTGFGAMLGYGWLYPKYWQALSDVDDADASIDMWVHYFGDERAKLLDVQVELDIMKRERAAFKAEQSANGKKARAIQMAAQADQAAADAAKSRDIASRLPKQPLRPREEVVAGVDERRAARRATLFL